MNKKASATMTTVFISIIITMALFYGGYNYITSNYGQANITDTLGYNESYQDLQTSESNLNKSVNDIRGSARNIAEADANIFLVAWNGLTGLAATIGLFFDVLDVGVNVFNALFPALAIFPDWVKLLAEMALIITIILIIIGAFKGETKT